MKIPRRVVITGVGILSPLGRGFAANRRAILDGVDGTSSARRVNTAKLRCHVAAEIDDSLADAAPAAGRRWHRASMIVATALREAVGQAGPGFQPEAVFAGTTSGGMGYGELFYKTLVRAETSAAPARQIRGWLTNYLPAKPVGDALSVCGIRAPSHIVATACASGADAIGLAMDRIKAGRATMIVAGGYDVLCELVYAGFDSLQALTTERCRPFDRGRSGLVLGEAAAFLALETLESAIARGAEILGEAAGYGAASDTFHPTQPDPTGRGSILAMERALRDAKIGSDSVSFINAHGTATIHNDNAEAAAIRHVFASRAVPVTSTKSMTGHTLGAAGALEAAFTVGTLLDQKLPPTINHREPEPDWTLRVVANQAELASVDFALSNSLGFAGTNASLIFRRASVDS